MPLSIYPYGFLLRPRSTEVRGPDGYVDVTFVGEFDFSHDPRRPVLQHSTPDGAEVLVFGRCYDLSAEEGDLPDGNVASALSAALSSSETAFLDRLDLLAGRWIVLTSQDGTVRLYHDAVGTRSVYYDAENRAASSHATLLGAAFDRSPSGVTKPSMTWGLSSHEGVRALLPNHRLDVNSGTIERYWPRQSNVWEQRSEVERLDRVIDLWRRQMALVKREGLPVRFALSGGLDSRTALALSGPYLDGMQTFTYGASPTAKPSSADVLNLDAEIVGPVAELLRLDHRVIRAQTPTPALDEQIRDDVGRNTLTAHGRWLLPYYLQEFPGEDSLVLRANAFEVGQHKWAAPSDADTAAVAQKRWVRFAQKSGVEIPGTELTEHVREAFRDQEIQAVQHGYLASDLTHWEFRLGRWATEVFNEIDVAFEPFVPLSCRAILTPLLAFSREQRASQYAFRELINRAHPVLNFFGINDSVNLYETWRDAQSSLPEGEHPDVPGADSAPVVHRLPIAAFADQKSKSFHVLKVPSDGHLLMALRTFWSSPGGASSFMYEINVDQHPVLRIPVPERAGPFTASVRNLAAGAEITLSIIPMRARSRPSWERATRIEVSDLTFTDSPASGPVEASIDDEELTA